MIRFGSNGRWEWLPVEPSLLIVEFAEQAVLYSSRKIKR